LVYFSPFWYIASGKIWQPWPAAAFFGCESLQRLSQGKPVYENVSLNLAFITNDVKKNFTL
jgi:hypothetical protein